jgi:peptide/nickel transport system permease protein
MSRYLATRFLMVIPVLFVVSLVSFSIMYMTPGDITRTILGQEARPEDVAALRQQLGLDDPIALQYGKYLARAAQGDLGQSIKFRRPVTEMIMERLPTTATLALTAILLSMLVAVPLGIIAAVGRGSLADFATMLIALVGISAPSFWVALMLIYIFSYKLHVLPATGLPSFESGGLDMFKHLLLPATSLALMSSALMARMVRSNMLEVLGRDYMRTARAKGLSPARVILQHGFRNALIPTVTVVGLQLSTLLGGAVVTETVFSLPGIGLLAADAIAARDFPVVQGVVLVAACVVTLVNLSVDLLYGRLDPRISYS